MKQTKNAWLVIISGLFMTAAIPSCSKKDSTPPPPAPKTTITSFTPGSGYSGDTITIAGTNFTGATAVTFGGTGAKSFTVVSATSIKAIIGTGTTGSVSVTAPTGTASLAGFTFNSGFPPVDGYSSSNEIEPASLIAYWPFDGNATELKHTAVPVLMGGTQTFVTGKIGQAVHLAAGWLTYGTAATSASADNTTFASNDTLRNGFTLSLWAQAPQTETLSTLFQLSSPAVANWPVLGIQFRKHADNSFDFDGGLTNVDGTGTHPSYAAAFKEPTFMDTTSWTLFTMTFDAGNKSLKYYANGKLVNTVDLKTTGGIFPDANDVLLMVTPNYATIGAAESKQTTPGSTNDPAGYMAYGITGNIDDIRLFRKTLTDKQVNDLFVLGNQGR
ncbi:MAG: IPT/TIG domain-containing protein [Ferruginibacter sp.]